MINIIFINRSLNYGGAERQLVNLAKDLNSEIFNPTILTFYSGPLAKDLREANVNTIWLEKKGRWDVFGFLFRLYRILKNLKPDVIHGYLTFQNILTILLKPFFPKARTVLGVRASNMDLSRYDWLARITDSLASFLSRFADLIIVNSKAGFNHSLSQGYPEKKMILIPNGIDTERFKPDRPAGLKVREEWGVGEHEILIGLVGRLDPMKDHPTFLQAASILVKKMDQVRFVCLGNGPKPYRDELIVLGNELGLSGRILWMDPRDDMPSVYNAFDIVSSSSAFGEGFPNVIGESMACDVPCVVTDVGDSPRVVGDTGIVVPKKNPEALSEAWIRLLTGDKNQAAHRARSRIQNNFSVEQLAKRTEEVLSKNLNLKLSGSSVQ
jgi:glycosyltransferase involved in cell wall biosynthesis